MAGSIAWNLLIAVFGFIFVFFASWTTNLWQTSITRGATFFFLFFIVTYILRLIWTLIEVDQSKTDYSSSPIEQDQGTQGSDGQGQESLETSAKETSEMVRSLLNEEESN